MRPRALLLIGLGLLLLGLLLVLGIDNPATNRSNEAVLVQGYLSNLCSTIGAGLVVVAALVSALRASRVQSKQDDPAIDYYA